ncbi:hypothetical protein FVE85_4971 [Porphyridium purpureum]|uniref:Mediator of RNA polymerase II transcription subunit 8 n=1 Tax=Porphyridium purpureum TaxID=35688 RepID=A0A5J4YSW3_PORPP|nr:hypothetical protein FVE85_4971 [Porphyridium purpureum]|eukprot:POR2279..scf236_6
MMQQLQQPPPQPPQEQQQQQLALQSMLNRALQLNARLVELRRMFALQQQQAALGLAVAQDSQWPVFLAKYDVICKLLAQVTSELQRIAPEFALDAKALVPGSVAAAHRYAADMDRLPNLLRTRPEPVVELSEHKLASSYEQKFGPLVQGMDARQHVRMWNELVQDLDELFVEAVDTHLPAADAIPRDPPPPIHVDAADMYQALERGAGLEPADAVAAEANV